MAPGRCHYCFEALSKLSFSAQEIKDQYDLPPSEEIREFWHHHILDTQKYIKDCSTIFGEYLHHYPYAGIDGKTTLHNLQQVYTHHTQALYYQEFGCHITQIRKPAIFQFMKLVLNFGRTLLTWKKSSHTQDYNRSRS